MRTKKTILNLIINILSVPVTALVGLWLTRLTIVYYGSDVNGLTSVITQIIAGILILEAGLSVALNARLYKPYIENDVKTINSILTTGKRIFEIISVLFSIIAFLIAILLPHILDTAVSAQTITILFVLAFLPTSIYLFYSLKYKPLYDISQSEYIFSFVTITMNILGQLVAIMFIYLDSSIELVRFWIMFFLILRSVFIYLISKKRYKEVEFDSVEKDYSFLKDMPSVFSLKITSLIYSTSPILYITIFLGTLMTSVYSIYNMIFTVLKSLAYAVVNAPFNAFGQLLTDKSQLENTREKFFAYQLVVIMFISIILTTCLLVIVPFMGIYTEGVNDINYLNYKLALLLCLVTFFEIIHIPSGIMMQVTGAFKESRKIQNISTALLLLGMFVFSNLYDLYGIIYSLIACNIILGYLEIQYAHKVIFKTNLFKVFSMIFLNLFISVIIIWILSDTIDINNYFEFVLVASKFFILNSIVVYILNFIIFKKYLLILNQLFLKKFNFK